MKTKKFKLLTVLGALSMGIILIAPTSCKKDKIKGCTDPVATNYSSTAEEDDGSCTYATPGPGTSTTDLLSKSVTSAPTMDGVIDASWANCQKLTGTAAVPSSITDFVWYNGETYNFTLRSMRDATNIYFLAEWTDPKDSKEREGWYFDTSVTPNIWKQQNKKATSATDKWCEDKLAMLWPTATTSLTDWNSSTCYSTCHGVNQTLGYNTTTKHYAAAGEVVDMWHWKRVRTGNPFVNQFDDQRIVTIVDINAPTATEKKDGGRGSDASTAGGDVANIQTLNNGTANVTVPKFIIPNQSNYYWITTDDTLSGLAKRVTAVDVNGVLTYAGGTIDPATGGYEMNTGAKRFPSIYTRGTFVGSRGDITAYGNHTGTGWVLEYKRALTTSDAANDVQFDVTKEYMFGFAIFENAAIAHGIKPNLKLKFN